MEKIVLFGVEKGSESILRDAIIEYTRQEGKSVIGVVSNAMELQGKIIYGYPVEGFEEWVMMEYDTVIVCAPHLLSERVVDLFRQRFHLSVKQCYSYQRPRIGNHPIDWSKVEDQEDIFRQLRAMPEKLNDLEKFFLSDDHRLIFKWMHYFEIYDRHFRKYRGKSPVVMEIGVFKGGSLQMWKEYFGEGTQIIGIDIDESTKEFEEDGITIEIGSQEDRKFLCYLRKKYPKVDILIDDGGHTMQQQIVTFEELFAHVSEEGCYLCEDLHTSYWERYGGGYKNPDSYIEYSKNFIDYINAWHCEELEESGYTRTMHSLHYYTSILVVEKRKMGYPIDFCTPNGKTDHFFAKSYEENELFMEQTGDENN